MPVWRIARVLVSYRPDAVGVCVASASVRARSAHPWPDQAARQAADARLDTGVRAVHQEPDGTYGVPRITVELRDHGKRSITSGRRRPRSSSTGPGSTAAAAPKAPGGALGAHRARSATSSCARRARVPPSSGTPVACAACRTGRSARAAPAPTATSATCARKPGHRSGTTATTTATVTATATATCTAPVRRLQHLQREEFGALLPAEQGRLRAAPTGVPRLPGAAHPACPRPRRPRPDASGGHRAPRHPFPPMQARAVDRGRRTQPRRAPLRAVPLVARSKVDEHRHGGGSRDARAGVRRPGARSCAAERRGAGPTHGIRYALPCVTAGNRASPDRWSGVDERFTWRMGA